MNSLLNAFILKRSSVADAYGLAEPNRKAQSGLGQALASERATSVSTSTKNVQATNTASSKGNREEVAFSARAMRAQRIQALSEVYFARGDFKLANLPSVLTQANAEGLLTQSQVARLEENATSFKDSSALPSLNTFIDNKLKPLSAKESLISEGVAEVRDANGSTRTGIMVLRPEMIKALKDAKTVLANMGDAQSNQMSALANAVSRRIGQYLNFESTHDDSPNDERANSERIGSESIGSENLSAENLSAVYLGVENASLVQNLEAAQSHESSSELKIIELNTIERRLWQGLQITMQFAALLGNAQSPMGQVSQYLSLAKR
ncbi:hypothetical protein [Shewanella acanthi]|uniref:hypothetical protein n=1 Tax=Shewanella acanthi TaxID=2864212 RepID=UPI001C65E571|nr:hypothetical protein [Shewanella acanthi]QYJ77670.1 hypothetical protein K0H61_11045 [Shewanella acanthi]